MANKIFGSEFADETNPIGTETVTIFNGVTHEDVTLRNLVYKIIANAPEEFTIHDDDNLALLDSQSIPINEANRVEFSAVWTWIASKIAALTGKTTPIEGDYVVVTDSADSNAPKKVLLSGLMDWVNSRVNYQISPSISSNNLVLAIKGMDGNDPSTNSPVLIKVGNTYYRVTAATSFTKNAGTNWMDMGSSELAAKDVDLFVYAIEETGGSAGLKFGYSRIPYAVHMADFVNTTTSPKYIAGNWTNFNNTDNVTVIGRFRTQLSAGAGYTWSIPTAKVINRPVFRTDTLDFTPTITYAGGTTNPTSNTVNRASYYIDGRDMRVHIRSTLVRGSGNRTVHTFTLPWANWLEGTSPANALTSFQTGGLGAVTGYMSGATFVFYAVTMASDGTYYGTGVNTMN